jgi:hypothetical protein
MSKADKKVYLFKWQKVLSIFFIVRGVITLASSMFWGLLEIIFWIIILPSILPLVLKKISWDEKKITPAKIYIAAIIIFIIGMISVGQNMPKDTNIITNNSGNNSIDNTELSNYTFDIPSLIWKNVDEIRNSFWSWFSKDDISEPTKLQSQMGSNQWDNSISKDGYTLLITYNTKTRNVIDLFLTADKNENNIRNNLMQIWNLKANANNYSIESVQAMKNPNEITGIKIISK